MNVFISLPWKILILLLTLLLVLGISISALWITQTEEDFKYRQQKIKQESRQQYSLFNRLLSDRIESWVESFVHIHEPADNTLESISLALSNELDFLRLNWTVNNIWLLDENYVPVFASADDMPLFVTEYAKKALEEQRPFSEVKCGSECLHVISIPILVDNNETAAFILSSSLLETLALLNNSSQAALAQVNHPAQDWQEPANQLKISGQISSVQSQKIQGLINKISPDLSVVNLFNQGSQIELDNKDYLLTLIAVNPDRDEHNFILLAKDISEIKRTHETYQFRVINLVGITFCLTGLLFFFLTNSFRKRLVYLAEKLPLLAEQKYHQFERRKSVFPHWMTDELDTLLDSANNLSNRLETLDKQAQSHNEQLKEIAMYDGLTKLPNRNMLSFQLNQTLADLSRKRGMAVLMFLDLDDFKKVNDSHGHNTGDALLVEAAKRLTSILRKTDMACRFGGDEFVVLLRHMNHLQHAEHIAEKILELFKRPVLVDELRFYVSTSIGVATTENDGCNSQELIRHADIAMYEAKQAGGSCYRIFDAQMSRKVQRQVALETEAREALEEEHFQLALQPQIALDTNELIGFEALLRWQHPERGMVSPGEFIPVLENTEFIIDIGYWCIARSFKLLSTLKMSGFPNIRIAINLSAAQFLDPNLVEVLQRHVETSGHPASLIELELTERTLVNDIDKAMEVMNELNGLGFGISIDDFGTGYSSLSYLKSMPLDQIKIDQGFIHGMLNNSADEQIVLSTISMVHNLGMKVVAEGIEEPKQLAILKEYACDYAQGYFIAKPIMEEYLIDYVKTHTQGHIWQISYEESS